jgi:hypothetical protein
VEGGTGTTIFTTTFDQGVLSIIGTDVTTSVR